MGDNIKISVVIVNWNGKDFLKPCLDSVFSQHFEGLEVVVVDNGSVDGSVDFLKDNYKGVVVVELTHNIGFAGGNNRGFEVSTGDYILTLNNDTVLKEGFFTELLSLVASSEADVGMWAPKILSIEDKSTIDSVGGLIISRVGIAKGRGRNEIDSGQFDNHESFIPSACCALYKKELLNTVGYFDEDFFAYCEDTDLGLRAIRAGYKTLNVPNSVVYHHYSKTTGRYSTKKVFFVERNHLWVVIKNFSLLSIALYPFLNFYRYLIQSYGLIAGRGAVSKASGEASIISLIFTVIYAYLLTVIKIPLMFYRRFYISGTINFKNIEQKNIISIKDLSLMD